MTTSSTLPTHKQDPPRHPTTPSYTPPIHHARTSTQPTLGWLGALRSSTLPIHKIHLLRVELFRKIYISLFWGPFGSVWYVFGKQGAWRCLSNNINPFHFFYFTLIQTETSEPNGFRCLTWTVPSLPPTHTHTDPYEGIQYPLHSIPLTQPPTHTRDHQLHPHTRYCTTNPAWCNIFAALKLRQLFQANWLSINTPPKRIQRSGPWCPQNGGHGHAISPTDKHLQIGVLKAPRGGRHP